MFLPNIIASAMWIGYPLWFTRSHQSFQIGHTHTLTEVNIGFIREKYQNYNTNTHVKLSWEAELHTFVSRKNENWKIHTQNHYHILHRKKKIKDIRQVWYKIWFSRFAFLISSIVVVWLVVLKTQQGRRKKGWHMESWGASSRQPPPSPPTFFRRVFWTFPKTLNFGA